MEQEERRNHCIISQIDRRAGDWKWEKADELKPGDLEGKSQSLIPKQTATEFLRMGCSIRKKIIK